MPRIQFNDSNALYSALAEDAFRQSDFEKCFEFASKLGNALSPELRDKVAYCAYRLGTSLAAKVEFVESAKKIQFAQTNSTDPVIRSLCNQRYELLRAVSRISPLPKTNCPICNNNPNVKPVRGLAETAMQPDVDSVYAVGAYRSGWDRQKNNKFSVMLRSMKEPNNQILVEAAGMLLAHFFSYHVEWSEREQIDFIIPVPTVPARFAKRGYAIPEILARFVSQQTTIPMYTNVVALNKETRDLRHLNSSERRSELANAFKVMQPNMVEQMSIVIVDDITTHGTTLCEIARTLRGNGAYEIIGLVLAHTEPSWM